MLASAQQWACLTHCTSRDSALNGRHSALNERKLFVISFSPMNPGDRPLAANWFALAVGNSRLHWAWFVDSTLKQTWDTPHASANLLEALGVAQAIAQLAESASPDLSVLNALTAFQSSASPPLWIASVVPKQTELWMHYVHARLLTLADIPLKNGYPTLGIDRALALWGGATTLGTPILVVDAGTALTFTGADAAFRLIGGAILPGLRLQYQALVHDTAALPAVSLPLSLPFRWATNTTDAIHSGILYGALAGVEAAITAWLEDFPESAIAVTGGDSLRLHAYLTQHNTALAAGIVVDQQLLFWGMLSIASA